MDVGIWVKRILGLALAIGISAGLWWLRPAAADPAALAVLDGSAAPSGSATPAPPDAVAVPATPALKIEQTRSYIDMHPSGQAPSRGLAFFTGALVDPRAYAKILAPIAEAGYLVSIIKSPYDLPIVDIGGVDGVVKRHPEVEWWASAGHSLGGVAASTFASGSPRTTPGLILWASYPVVDLSSVDELTVLSVSGTQDGLTTPADVESSKAKLPDTTTYVAVQGAVHAFFGDYGEQPGDGEPTIPREQAQEEIVATTLHWLNTVTAPPPQ